MQAWAHGNFSGLQMYTRYDSSCSCGTFQVILKRKHGLPPLGSSFSLPFVASLCWFHST